MNEIKAKQIVVKSNLPSSDYVINPYVGCTHGCYYCYASFMRRFYKIEKEWGSFVYPKTYEGQLKPDKYSGKTIVIGSVTDAYQPIEAKTLLTRSILEKLIGCEAIFEIITKSSLVTRDIDLLKKLSHVKVGVSICSDNDNDIKIFEKLTNSYSIRVNTLKALHKEGVKTYVFISPIIPYITDVLQIIDDVKPYVDEIYIENINLNNTIINSFREIVYKNYPDIAPKILSAINKQTYWDTLKDEIVKKCTLDGIKLKVFFYHNKR